MLKLKQIRSASKLTYSFWFWFFDPRKAAASCVSCSTGIMFTSQTSSFQDSIDVDERDDFDSEDIPGYSQKIQLNCYYTIYLYEGTRSVTMFSHLVFYVRATLVSAVDSVAEVKPRNRLLVSEVTFRVKINWNFPTDFILTVISETTL